MLSHYQKCVNKIEDYLEYRYRGDTPDKIKEKIMGHIDELTENIALDNEKKETPVERS